MTTEASQILRTGRRKASRLALFASLILLIPVWLGINILGDTVALWISVAIYAWMVGSAGNWNVPFAIVIAVVAWLDVHNLPSWLRTVLVYECMYRQTRILILGDSLDVYWDPSVLLEESNEEIRT